MRKIRLDLEHLHVDTFDTTAAKDAERGTIHGNWSQPGTCDAMVGTCQPGGSCAGTCRCTGAACV